MQSSEANTKGFPLSYLPSFSSIFASHTSLSFSFLCLSSLSDHSFYSSLGIEQRDPIDATPRYTLWHNSITQQQLYDQQFREVTIAQPTWFMNRSLFSEVGGYNESFPDTPEDLIFFYAHLCRSGKLIRIDQELLLYRYHSSMTSLGIHRLKLLELRVKHFERMVLNHMSSLVIWSAGRDGKKFFQTLSPSAKRKVVAFCDVDPKKIGNHYHDPLNNRHIPIIHFSDAAAPAAIWYLLLLSSK